MAADSEQTRAERAPGDQQAEAAGPGDHAHDDHDPLSPAHLIGHVKDAEYFHFPRLFSPETDGKVYVPQLRESTEPIVVIKTGSEQIDQLIEPLDGRITKFMVLELVAALILVVLFVPVAYRARSGGVPRGRLWNLLEAMVVFVRDHMARPAIGRRDGDRYTPFLLTLFFFVLTCNLLGLVPWAGSPTGALGATGALAAITYAMVVLAGSLKLGPAGYWLAQVPHMDLPLLIALPIKPMILAIEVAGMLIKHFVLAVRLFANMLAGHVVLGVLIALIGAAAMGSVPPLLVWLGVAPASVLGATAFSMLELFVAFLQAYIFTFLASLFIGMAIHPH